MDNSINQLSDEQKNLLKLIPDYLPQGLVIYNHKGFLIYANKTAFQMFGTEAQNVYGVVNIFDDPNITKRDKDLLKEGLDVAFETDYDFDICDDTFFDTKNKGKRKYFVTRVSVMRDERQNIQGYLLTCEDVSEKKYQEIALMESNKKIETIHKNLSLALEAGKLMAWNYNVKEQAFYPIDNKMRSNKKLFLERALDKVHPDDKEKLVDFIRSIINKKKTADSIILRFLNRWQDKYLYFDNKFVSVSDETGNITDITFIQRDITNEKEYQEELLKAKEKAEESDKLKSAFLANMSHEIRTPLNAIVGFSDLLAISNNEQDKQVYANIISENNELLLHLIGDILDLSKIEANTVELQSEYFDISELCDSLYSTMQLKVTNPNVEFKIENPYSNCWVTLDKNRLKQVGINFITNSIKCTNSGYIKMGYEYTEGGIKIYVEDTGIGIARENHHKVFKRFQKLNDLAQGTGLGLAISQAIVERCGGKIGFESEPGKGSTFWAWIPCEAEIEKKELQISKKPDLSNSDCKKSRIDVEQIKILVAEDNDSNYLLMEHTLRPFKLTRVRNGKEAVEIIGNEHFDIIFMDMRMPVMGGLEATLKIRNINREIIIVAVTANAFDEDRENAQEAGCNAFLTKPLKKKKLFDLIESFL